MNYLYITLDAIKLFVSLRKFQSSEYAESKKLCEILRGDTTSWDDSRISFYSNSKGGSFFFTNKIDRLNGILFDYDKFDAFITKDCNSVITIFQKTLKYSIRYFDKLPLAACEKHVTTETSIVFPFPFTATRDVYKILIDRNSSKIDRKGKNILTVFFSGITEGSHVQFTSLNKAVDEIPNLKYIENPQLENQTSGVSALGITDLEKLDLSIDSKIGYENWTYYLTQKQKDFIEKEVVGPERLEGAAGTGKTLTMILRCINLLKRKLTANEEYSVIFVTHSLSTKNSIIDIFRNNYPDVENYLNKKDFEKISLTVITLQEWCINYLGAYLSDTEYLDKDAKDSKELQLMYIADAFSKVKESDYETYKHICSERFIHFIDTTSIDVLLEMLQYEIAVTIKGRANGDIEKYKLQNRLKYTIPCESDNDFSFLFLIYKTYQESLESVGQYDSDDIILTALGQLNTPIWRRRRSNEGFHVSFLDETHLYNMNELSIFHYLNRIEAKNNIIFAIDKSQAVGERGILDDSMREILGIVDTETSINYKTVFRSSPDITNLAFNVLSSGALLFTNFDNPLDNSSFGFTEEDENKCINPIYKFVGNDDLMVAEAFKDAEKYSRENNVLKSKILIISTTDYLLTILEKYAHENHKPYEALKSRGDSKTVSYANYGNKFVIGGIDYVGGLEFDAVVIIGIDKGRVPPTITDKSSDSFHFQNYAWHNRMYVAITRAKYAIILIGDKSRGVSPLIESAIYNGVISIEE